MKTMSKKHFFTKEEGLRIFKELESQGFSFNGDMEYYMESFNKEVPSETDEVCSIPMRYVGWDHDAKKFFVLSKFILVSKKDMEEGLARPIVYNQIGK
jgi:hypothetical protein